MKGLKCTTSNCEHNHNYHCDAGVINIGKNASCRTKIKREFGSLGQSFVNMQNEVEFAEDFDYAKNQDVVIQCDSTKCKFNSDNLCTSELVNVGTGIVRTKCFTKDALN